MTRLEAYRERARQLLLSPEVANAFVALNDYADTTGYCPSCGATVSRHESDRCTHARTCNELLSDANESRS